MLIDSTHAKRLNLIRDHNFLAGILKLPIQFHHLLPILKRGISASPS